MSELWPCMGKVNCNDRQNYDVRFNNEYSAMDDIDSYRARFNEEDLTMVDGDSILTNINPVLDPKTSIQINNLVVILHEGLLNRGIELPFDIERRRIQMVKTLFAWREAVKTCPTGEILSRLTHRIERNLKVLKPVCLNYFTRFSNNDFQAKFTREAVCSSGPLSTFFHCCIDLHWFELTIDYVLYKDAVKCINSIKMLIIDLVDLALSTFNTLEDNAKNTPLFLCHCHRQLWLLVQLMYEHSSRISSSFWDMLKEITENKPPLFRLWLVKNLAELQLYNPDGRHFGPSSSRIDVGNDILDSIFQALAANQKSTDFVQAFELGYDLMTSLWIDKINIMYCKTIWEYLYKNLKQHSLKLPDSALDILLMRKQFESLGKITEDSNVLLMFLKILVHHLKEYPNRWKQMQSRFYNRFLPERMQEFDNRTGQTIVFIYMVLTEIHFTELAQKTLQILATLPAHTIEQKRGNWNLHLALIMLHIDKRTDISKCTDTFMPLVANACNDRDQFELVALFISNLPRILRMDQHFTLNQHTLFNNSGLPNYLRTARIVDLLDCINLFELSLDLAANTPLWPPLLQEFRIRILPQMKQMLSKPVTADIPTQIGRVVATLAIKSPDLRQEIVAFYMSAECLSSEVTLTLITELLKDSAAAAVTLSNNQERLVVQAWVRCMLSRNCTIHESARVVFRLASLSGLNLPDNEQINYPLARLMTAFKPLCAAAPIPGRPLFDHCFGAADTGAKAALARHWQTPAAIRDRHTVYNVLAQLGLLVFHCAELMHRNGQLCPLTRVLGVSVLAQDVMLGKDVDVDWLKALRKVWILYYDGVDRIATPTAHQPRRLLVEMIVRYATHYPENDSPIVDMAVKHPHRIRFIVSRIVDAFLMRTTRSVDDKRKTFRLIDYMLAYEGDSDYRRARVAIVEESLPGIFEAMMTCEPVRPMAIATLYRMSADTVVVCEALQASAAKKLAFCGEAYLRMLLLLVPKFPDIVRRVMPRIKTSIEEVEEKQGIQWYHELRNAYAAIQKLLAGTD